MATLSLAKKVSNWNVLNEKLKQLLEEHPDLKLLQEEFETVYTNALAFQREEEEARARFRGATRRRQLAEKKGDEIRERLAAILRGKLGFRNEDLIAFGILPRRPARKPTQEELNAVSAPPQSPAATPASE